MKFCSVQLFTGFLIAATLNVAAQPTPPTIITQDTTLSGPASTPFVIGADHVTLDCNGFNISPRPGPPSFFSGISMDNRKGVTIKNCDISNWLFGIRLVAFSSVTLENIAIRNCMVNGLDANDGSRILMNGSFSSIDNGVFGIVLQNDVSMTMKGANAIISENLAGVQIGIRSSLVMEAMSPNPSSSLTSVNNEFFGITATSNSHLFLFGRADVVASNNGSNGLTIFTKSAVEVDRDGTLRCDGNNEHGIRVEDSSINLFTVVPETAPQIYVRNNGDAGITLGKGSVFDTNNDALTTIANNANGGLLVDNKSIATVRSATINDNGFADVYLSFGSSGDFEDNTIGGGVMCDSMNGNYIRGDELCQQISSMLV